MAMSSRSTTPEKQRARRDLAALARVGIDVCNILATRGEENHDAPRHYLARLDLWTVGEESGATLAARTRAVNAWGGSLTKGQSSGETARLILFAALAWIADYRAAVAAGRDATTIGECVVRRFAMVVQCVEGGELESAEQRVRTMLEERRVAATADASE